MNGTATTVDSSAEAVPMGAREFARWFDGARDGLPPHVQEAATLALLSLRSREQAAYAYSVALQTGAVSDLRAFTTAYAEWEARS